MTTTIRAHYDGKVIVPDEPVDLPVNQPLEVSLRPSKDEAGQARAPNTIEERLERLGRAMGRIKQGPVIPDEALRRENLYEEQW